MRRVKIISDGTIFGTQVIDIESGEPLRATKIKVDIDTNDKHPIVADVTLIISELNLTLDAKTSIFTPKEKR